MSYKQVHFPDGTVRHVLEGAASIRIPRQTGTKLKVSMTNSTDPRATFEMDEYRIIPDGGGWRAELVTTVRGTSQPHSSVLTDVTCLTARISTDR